MTESSLASRDSWTLQISRDDLSKTRVIPTSIPGLADGEVSLRVDRIGVTANNITYAVLGETWGIVPLWGFADVVESKAEGVEVGPVSTAITHRRDTWWSGLTVSTSVASVTAVHTAPSCRLPTTPTR